ncbi:MAG: FadR family transcriptional regulator [Propionibacteriaceae bacterium]|jgi:GntR family transcriptional repressor for pyruvate dehydrogenase complex|nr:FadR family transcriptional regulator [Propionibacteriaceae bacterium]
MDDGPAQGRSAPEGPIIESLVRDPSLTDRVSRRLTDLIREGELRQGALLPSERVMASQFGVSRTVIRESIRALSARGLVESVSGRGVVVTADDTRVVSEALGLIMTARGEIDLRKIYEVRYVLEIPIARMAAERADAADVADLTAIVEGHSDSLDLVETASEFDVAFHRRLAVATGNDLFAVLLDSLSDLMLTLRTQSFTSSAAARRAVEFHQDILLHVAAGDGPGAERAMRRHFDDSLATLD